MNIPPSESATVTADGTIVSNLNFTIRGHLRFSRGEYHETGITDEYLAAELSTGLTTSDERWRIKLLRPPNGNL
jgi:hypothetical protein